MEPLDIDLDLSVHEISTSNPFMNNPQGIIVDDQVSAQMSITCSGNRISASGGDETQWNLDESIGDKKSFQNLVQTQMNTSLV